MKRLAILMLAAAIAVAAGCSPDKKTEKAPAPRKRPVVKDTSKNMHKRYDAISKSPGPKEGMDIFLVREALQKYRSENGRYPSSLDRVQDYLDMEIELGKYSYDPQTGRVALTTPPE